MNFFLLFFFSARILHSLSRVCARRVPFGRPDVREWTTRNLFFFTEDKVEKQPENEVERTVNIPPRVCEKWKIKDDERTLGSLAWQARESPYGMVVIINRQISRKLWLTFSLFIFSSSAYAASTGFHPSSKIQTIVKFCFYSFQWLNSQRRHSSLSDKIREGLQSSTHQVLKDISSAFSWTVLCEAGKIRWIFVSSSLTFSHNFFNVRARRLGSREHSQARMIHRDGWRGTFLAFFRGKMISS